MTDRSHTEKYKQRVQQQHDRQKSRREIQTAKTKQKQQKGD